MVFSLIVNKNFIGRYVNPLHLKCRQKCMWKKRQLNSSANYIDLFKYIIKQRGALMSDLGPHCLS